MLRGCCGPVGLQPWASVGQHLPTICHIQRGPRTRAHTKNLGIGDCGPDCNRSVHRLHLEKLIACRPTAQATLGVVSKPRASFHMQSISYEPLSIVLANSKGTDPREERQEDHAKLDVHPSYGPSTLNSDGSSVTACHRVPQCSPLPRPYTIFPHKEGLFQKEPPNPAREPQSPSFGAGEVEESNMYSPKCNYRYQFEVYWRYMMTL